MRAIWLSLAAVTGLAGQAQAADRWQEAGGGAVAILPVPLKATAIIGGSLDCAEQRWSLRLSTEPQPPGAVGAAATLDIDGAKFETTVTAGSALMTLPMPFETLDLLKDGSRLTVAITGGSVEPTATFSLRGSRAVLDAVIPRCSQVDMSDYEAVSLLEQGPGTEEAKPFFEDDAREFRAWTGRQPTYSAAILDLEAGKRLLFASMCGSNTYFGPSGCSLKGFAAEATAAEWRPVYETEGVLLHTDPKASNGGWPNLVTLPAVNGFEPNHWIWTGTEYELREVVAAEESGEPAEEGDAGAQ